MITPIEQLLSEAVLTPVPPPSVNPDNLPFATHEGWLDLGCFQLKVYQLNTGQRILDGADVERLFGGTAP